MKSMFRVLFQPLANRHYTNKKTSAILYATQYIPLVLICALGAVTVDGFFWLVLLGFLIVGLIDYLFFDALLDKLGWNLFWKRFYKNELPASKEHLLMKELEKNPSPENQQKLADHLQPTQHS